MTSQPPILATLLAAGAIAAAGATPAFADPMTSAPRPASCAARSGRPTRAATSPARASTAASRCAATTPTCSAASFVAPIIEDDSSYDHPYGDTRITGRWHVKRAKLRNRRYGTVRVAYTTDAGERGTVVLTATRRGATLGGVPAAVSRTNAC